MALSRIWASFFLVASVVALFKFLTTDNKVIFTSMVTGKTGDTVKLAKTDTTTLDAVTLQKLDSTKTLTLGKRQVQRSPDRQLQYYQVQGADGIIETCKTAVTISIGLIGIMALFMGFMSIAERAGGIRLLSKIIGPFFSRLFPEIPKGHPALGHMMMNFSANLMGLDNAATPFGIKAMQSLQELNGGSERASNAQIMFLCLHASGLTLIPVAIIAARAALKAPNPTDIFVPCMVATFIATIAAMIIVSLRQKINLLQPVILAWIGVLSLLIALLVQFLVRMNAENVQSFSALLSNSLILCIFLLILFGDFPGVFDGVVSGVAQGFVAEVSGWLRQKKRVHDWVAAV